MNNAERRRYLGRHHRAKFWNQKNLNRSAAVFVVLALVTVSGVGALVSPASSQPTTPSYSQPDPADYPPPDVITPLQEQKLQIQPVSGPAPVVACDVDQQDYNAVVYRAQNAESQVRDLKAQNADLAQQIAELQAQIEQLKQQQVQPTPTPTPTATPTPTPTPTATSTQSTASPSSTTTWTRPRHR